MCVNQSFLITTVGTASSCGSQSRAEDVPRNNPPQRFPRWSEQLKPHNYPQVGVWRTFDAVNELTGNGAVAMEL